MTGISGKNDFYKSKKNSPILVRPINVLFS